MGLLTFRQDFGIWSNLRVQCAETVNHALEFDGVGDYVEVGSIRETEIDLQERWVLTDDEISHYDINSKLDILSSILIFENYITFLEINISISLAFFLISIIATQSINRLQLRHVTGFLYNTTHLTFQ